VVIIRIIRSLPFDLVIFECGGVLVDSEGISDDVLAAMLTEQGLATTPAEAGRRYQGKLPSQVRRSVERRIQRDLPSRWLDEL
jgi:beta-phosphoglucomutase-like phosphatase (HAD superfamily)